MEGLVDNRCPEQGTILDLAVDPECWLFIELPDTKQR